MRVLNINDIDFVNHVLTHDSIYPFISDDQEIDRDKLAEVALNNSEFLLISPNDHTIFLLTPINKITKEVHTCILPEGRGKCGIESGKYSIWWVFKNTECKKLISWVPTFNRVASLYAIKCGFKREGVCKKSFQKNSKVYDMILYGIEKGVI